ncbi:hypothetical protein TNCV_2016651 [Trichonephila clavipes]|nr:hypothetical protein TNCV_2016651 [Trichonephila clavipes]
MSNNNMWDLEQQRLLSQMRYTLFTQTMDNTMDVESVFFPVNGDRYRAMITNFFIPELNNHDVQELWFQQDSATCHTARATIDLLKDTFGDRLFTFWTCELASEIL